jgi:hypothetical protein
VDFQPRHHDAIVQATVAADANAGKAEATPATGPAPAQAPVGSWAGPGSCPAGTGAAAGTVEGALDVSTGGAMDDAMRLLAGTDFFADGLPELFAAVFSAVFSAVLAGALAGTFAAAFLAGTAGVAGDTESAGLTAFELAAFLTAVLAEVSAGAGAAPVSDDGLAGAFLPAAFRPAATGAVEVGAGVASGFTVVADEVFVREPIFSARVFFAAAAPLGPAVDLEVRGA